MQQQESAAAGFASWGSSRAIADVALLMHLLTVSMKAIFLDGTETGELIRLLTQLGLPAEDVDEPGRTFFRFEDDAGLIGYGGWEGRGADRLLRSLVITPARQRQGLGSTALAKIEFYAHQSGAERLHLLTTTAAMFFRSHGYLDAVRSDAPDSIRASNEFTSLCPASANYMIKDLSDDHSPQATVHAACRS